MSEDENLSPLWDDLLKDHEAETPLGEVALFRGYVTPDQLEECLHRIFPGFHIRRKQHV